MREFELLTVNSLEKIFADKKPKLIENENQCFKNETFSFQVAYRHNTRDFMLQYCSYEIISDLKEYISVRQVFPILCTTPISKEYDDYYLTTKASLVPDILREDNNFFLRYRQWASLWIRVKGDLPIGKHNIKIKIKDGSEEELGTISYKLEVLNEELPKSDIKYSNWFHYDSLAKYYNLEIFSEAYNKIMWTHIKNAIEHGVNVLLIPLFTPPLNTAYNLERATTQLVDISIIDGRYYFNFERLEVFLKKAKSLGIEYFEMSHLYSQWGAKFAPKIIAKINGKDEQIFGWKDKALDEKYLKFIKQFLKELTKFLMDLGYDYNCCFFHISDEPNELSLEHYLKIRNEIKPILGKYKIFDALSNYKFYSKGAVDIPVVTTDGVKLFKQNNVKDMWVYYCCGQGHSHLSNRFMSMPLQRVRIIGFQLYINNCKGFLQWGYNYYNTALSERYVNPYEITDADGSFQSGDSFIVYPGESGKVYDSIRHEVILEAFQDYRALKLLEDKIGREKVVKFLKSKGFGEDYTTYKPSAKWHNKIRNEINYLIMNNIE